MAYNSPVSTKLPKPGPSATQPKWLNRLRLGVFLFIFALFIAAPFLAYRTGLGRHTVTPEVRGFPYPSSVAAELVNVVDGDTLAVRVGGTDERVQLLGVDAPELFRKASKTAGDSVYSEWESTDDPNAQAGKRLLADFLRGKPLTLEFEERERDRYGRLLAYVWVEDRGKRVLVNQWVLEHRVAQLYRAGEGLKYSARLREAAGLPLNTEEAESE
jgi:endonuclease YncB( thermonuclease family)